MRIRNIKILLLIFAALSFQTSTAQSVSSIIVECNQVFSAFRFVDRTGDRDNTFAIKVSGAYNVGYQYQSEEGFILGGNVGLYNAGATKVYSDLNYTWNLQYERFKLDLGYVENRWQVKPYLLVSPYYGYLLKATELIGTADYDLKKQSAISKSDIGIVTTLGAKIHLSKMVNTFVAYNHNFGLLDIEKSAGQKLYNRGFYLSLGLGINLLGLKNNSHQQTNTKSNKN